MKYDLEFCVFKFKDEYDEKNRFCFYKQLNS